MPRMLLLLAALGTGVLTSGCADGGQPDTTTRRLPRSGWVFDVPAEAPLELERVDRRYRHGDTLPDLEGAPPPFALETPFYRRDFGPLPEILAVVVHGPSRSRMHVDLLAGRELERLIRIPHRPNEAYLVVPRHSSARYLVELDAWVVEGPHRFPLDRISVLPDVAVQFARTPADGLFDQLIATLRLGRLRP